MNLLSARPLCWDDVGAEISTRFDGLHNPPVVHKNRNGETRVYVHLKDCSFVSETLWVVDPDLSNPVFRAVLLLKLTRKLSMTLKRISKYTLVNVEQIKV